LEKPTQVSIKSTAKVDTVSLQLVMDAVVKITGAVTGTEYIFNGAGSIVKVDAQDKDDMLNKKRKRSCCGGTTADKAIFVLLEE